MELSTPRLRIREFKLSDVPSLHAFESDPRVTRHMSYEPQSLEQTRKYVEDRIADQEQEPRRCFDLAITLSYGDKVIGRCGMKIDRPAHREAAIWYVLHPDHWGNGYAAEALRAFISNGFSALSLHRIWADIDPRNDSSIRLVERLGFTREGHLRENYFLKGEWCDTLIYGLLETELSAL